MSYKSLLHQYKKELIDLRKYFHRFPELANEEFETANYIESYLKDCGLEVKRGLAKTGLVGLLRGTAGPTIAFRAEMDGLPINEDNEVDYRSTRANVMHACGHDGHMAVALITAKILSKAKERLKGNVMFVFQPAEENLPEGGAKRILAEGKDLFSNIHAIFGFHFWPSLATGTVAVGKGAMMAAGDIFEVKFTGIGAHVANHYQSSDVPMMTSEAVLALTSIALRNVEPGVLSTMSIGVICSGRYPNVLPSKSLIKGTTRYVDDSFREFFPKTISRIVGGICHAYNASYDLAYSYGYPVLRNDRDIAKKVIAIAHKANFVTSVIEVTTPSLTSEDFAVYLEKLPGCYYWVGTQNNNSEVVNLLHNSKFDIDEGALFTATEMYLSICEQMLSS